MHKKKIITDCLKLFVNWQIVCGDAACKVFLSHMVGDTKQLYGDELKWTF